MFILRQATQNQTLQQIPDGVAGIGETLSLMTRFVREYKTHDDVLSKALLLTKHLDQKDFYGEIEAIFDFVQNDIRYVQDPVDVEKLQTPPVTLQLRSGDCDDKSTLLAALLEAIGHPTRFQAIGLTHRAIDHVYVETRLGADWIALDATEPHEMGWAPPRHQVKARITRHN